jgi:hypothetical protein
MSKKGRSNVRRMGGGAAAGKPMLGGGGGSGKPMFGAGGGSGKARFWSAGRAMVMLVIILGGMVTAGSMSYQSDQLYLQNKTNATISIPTDLIAGGAQAMLVTATDNKGAPLGNENVKVFFKDANGNKTKLFDGYTDESGSVEPVITAPTGMVAGSKGTLVVEAAGQTMTRAVKITATEEGLASAGRLIISTDKPIYQPEQIVHIRILGFEGKVPVASKKVVTVEVQDPAGNKIYKKALTPNDYGVSALDYALSDQLPVGNYKITADLSGIAKANTTVLVKRYVLPKFKIDVNGTKSWYTVNETIKGTLVVDYFFGKHVQGQATIEATVYQGVWKSIFKTKENLDENGRLPFTIPPAQYAAGLDINNGNGYMALNVSVTDTGGHKEDKSYLITIAKSPINIVLLADTNLEGTDSTYTAICRWPTGVPVQDATVTFLIGGNSYAFTSDERGLATVTFPYRGETSMTLKVTKGDTFVSEAFSMSTSEGIKVVPDKYYYQLGEQAQFKVDYTGNSMTDWAYYDVLANGYTVDSGHFKLDHGKGEFTVTVDRAMSPSARIRVYKIEKDMALARDSVAIAVQGLSNLKVEVLPQKQTYRPGDDVSIDFQVSQNSTGVPSILGINVVDLSVYELSDRLVGLDQVFWQLSTDYTEPTYQILDYVYMKDTYTLPYDHTQQIDRRSCNNAPVILESSWAQNLVDAKNFKNDNIRTFWQTLFIVGILGYVGLIVLAFRFKRAAVGMVVLMMVMTMGIATMLMALQKQTNNTNDTFDQNGFPVKQETGVPAGGGAPPLTPGGINFGLEDTATLDKDGTAQGKGQGAQASTGTSKPAHVRDYFPETWYWNPTLITDGTGHASVSLEAPDSMTTWGVDVMASTKDAKFGQGSANITVFQDFFVEPDIPVSAVRNDTFELRILIYNYLKTDEDITVDLKAADWYQLVDGTPIKTVHVAASSVSNVTFMIKATKVGWQDVAVTASAGSTGWKDAIVKQMLVEPDGRKVEAIANGQLTDNASVSTTIELDPNRVPDSQNAYVKLQASMEAVTVDGADQYIQYVSGCGEQSMSGLDIDVLAFAAMNKSSVPAEKIAGYETMVTQGIQHELIYLQNGTNGKGQGIVWFPSDQDVHPWLTSWGLITFQDARNAGFTVDDKIMTNMQSWLVSQQETDGSFKFPDWGLYEYNNPILKSKQVATTAYIMRALIYSGYDPNSEPIQKAKAYIESHIDEQMSDPYTIAIAGVGLEEAQGDPLVRTKISDKLHEEGKFDNGSAYWTSSNNMLSDGNDEGGKAMDWGYGNSDSRTIETTGYVIMAQMSSGDRADAMAGIKYLLDSRMGHGYFSTQDTVVAFQALAMAGGASVDNMDVSVYANKVLVDTVHFDKTNKELTVTTDLRKYLDPVNGTEIELRSLGKGNLVFQVYMSQYLPWSPENRTQSKELTLNVTYSTLNLKVDDTLTATLDLVYTGGAKELKMVLVQLKAPVGFSFVTDSLERLVADHVISMYELGPGEAQVYIQNVEQGIPISFEYQLLCNKPVKASIQGVQAFDMYNPQVKTEILPVDIVATI